MSRIGEYKLWRSRINIRILVKQELRENVLKVRSDKAMALVLVFEKKVMRVICANGPHAGRSHSVKDQFYNEIAREGHLQNPGKMIRGLGEFNRHVERLNDGFVGVHGAYEIGNSNVEEQGLHEFCYKKMCVASTCFQKEQRKITCSMDRNITETNFVLAGKKMQCI